MKTVLIISYYWPPSGGAGVQRWLKFAKYLPEFGWNPIIFTPENPEAPSTDNSLLKDIGSEIKVIKTPIWEPYTFYKKFTGKKKSDKINAGFIKEKKTNPFLEDISTFIRGNFFIPDARKFWVSPSIKFLKEFLKENKVDVIISSGPPHSMHLIALELKKQLGIKWIADFRDPWTNIDFYSELKLTKNSDRKHKRLEKEVLLNADCVISVGDTLSNELLELGASNIETITNGFDTTDIPEEKPIVDEKFSIVHLGSINKDRNHKVFWDVIENLINKNPEFKNKVEIKFIGKVDISIFEQVERLNLNKNFIHLEYISHNKVIIELMKAQLLYLPINNTPNAKGILTGKFFEYLASKRPILAIGLIESDIAKILHSTNAGSIFDFNDFDGLENYIQKCFNDYLNSKDDSKVINIDTYSRKRLTQKLSNLLNKITDD